MTIKNLKFIGLEVLASLSFFSCGRKEGPQPEPVQLAAPSHIYFERVSETMVRVCWRDRSEDEKGFTIWNGGTQIGEVEQNETEFLISSGLAQDNVYNIGVRAEADSKDVLPSEIASAQYRMIAKSVIPSAVLESSKVTESCVALTYRIRNTESFGTFSCGVCWCDAGFKPTMEDNCLAGPELSATGSALQMIPSVNIADISEKEYRIYISSELGTYYFDAVSCTLKPQPEAITFKWTKVDTPALPSGISVYSTEDGVNGRPFRAWYAVADLRKSDLELRTNVPSKVTTIDDQAASFWGDCYIMTNGGYFASGAHTGIAINDYEVTGRINNARGSIDPSDKENQQVYPTTRGIFGVDGSGNPLACWATGTKPEYYNYPVPSVKGEQKYPAVVSQWEGVSPLSWAPRAAISAGPLLLKDGICPFDFTITPKGDSYYYTNFEFIAGDIFGPDVICDRTSVGCTADGKVVLFICDGRMASSPGLTLVELAMVMKGLGCTDALNLDGGGSTGMMVGDRHYGDTTVDGNRPVMSTIGFFRKK